MDLRRTTFIRKGSKVSGSRRKDPDREAEPLEQVTETVYAAANTVGDAAGGSSGLILND